MSETAIWYQEGVIGMLRGKAAAILSVLAAIMAVAVVAHYAGRPKLLEINLMHLYFNHANQTYAADQNISVWASYTLRFRGTSVRFSVEIAVKDASGKEVYRDPVVMKGLSVTPVASTPRNHIWDRTGTIRSGTFTLQEPGEYEVSITARGGESHDTTRGTFKVA